MSRHLLLAAKFSSAALVGASVAAAASNWLGQLSPTFNAILDYLLGLLVCAVTLIGAVTSFFYSLLQNPAGHPKFSPAASGFLYGLSATALAVYSPGVNFPALLVEITGVAFIALALLETARRRFAQGRNAKRRGTF